MAVNTYGMKRSLDLSSSGHGPVVDSCKHSDKPLGSTRGREFLDHMSDNQRFMQDSAPWCQLNLVCIQQVI